MALRDLWGSAPEPPAALTAALAELDRLSADRPALAAPGRALGALLRAAFGREPTERPFDPDSDAFLFERIAEAWREGVPAVRVVPPPLDAKALHARGLAVCEALDASHPAAAPLRAALRDDPRRLLAWADANLSGRGDDYADALRRLGLDPALTSSVLRLALAPALVRWASKLVAPIADSGWSRGDCPVCGEPPVLAEARGLEQRRALRCGLCAADWPGARLRCPACASTDHRAFTSRAVEGEQDRYRRVDCRACGFRLKVVSTLTRLSAPGLLVAELATAHLDGLAERDPDQK